MIDVDGLSFEYPAKRALDGVGFHIGPGTVTALVGPNGAGKTTLLRCLATLELPYAGRVLLGGIDTAEEPRRARRLLGFLDEFFGLYDELTVLQCLQYWAGAHGLEGDVTVAARDAAARLGLADRLEERAGSLSRGLRQRLAIAQVIIHKPRILLMDEPASGLDPEARAGLADLIRSLQADGMTIVVSSHILVELADYSTHMLIVDKGRVIDHSPIGGAERGAARLARRLRLVLARPVAAAALAGLSVGPLDLDGEGAAVFDFAGSLDDQAALLRDLVARGLPVAALAEDHTSLQDQYIEKLKASRP
ncbi:ABC transporter ATP-binding protein [Zavarzinia compransoris]|uniref:ABC transporter ATP-binding protein n=1 Tax=Zavarzinia compransoris TaxID=1264899 RepID=A0A317EA41_9PROT|nr:ABC transporter ATP-binding protein [Zavarzinia compransoris]PWR23978.1 ABC transporter ATP-binding protein [Zavarzinia compransoris]TDP48234.1 ABC-2 type transport system ATP-binding protein [Zavarzinia compransoris]